ncbi:MAG: tRNA pseudouridine(55) synthase TruB [Myxococcota bacterium]
MNAVHAGYTKTPQGILLVDKEPGPSSFALVRRARATLGAKRVGHAGTLDPLASGLMVLMVGSYTRLSDLLTGHDKTYEAEIAFGRATTTDDAAGDVLEEGDAGQLDEAKVRAALVRFVGEQTQVPPTYCAVHVQGKRAYRLARAGKPVTVPPRTIHMREIRLLRWAAPVARARVRCSKGTYIRALARDVGRAVGVPAHLAALRRTSCGPYAVEDALAQSRLTDPDAVLNALHQGPSTVPACSRVVVDEEMKSRLCRGQQVTMRKTRRLSEPESLEGTAVAFCGGELVALVRRQADTLIPLRVVAV